jgi:hypothetical protein
MGSHEEAFAKQCIVPVIRQLYHLLTQLPPEEVEESFELDKNKMV